MSRYASIVIILMPILALIFALSAIPAAAQNPPPTIAHTTDSLNVRTGPGTTYPVITILPADTAVIVEGHNGDRTWVMIHTPDQSTRGWVSNEYVAHPPSYILSAQHVFIEYLATPVPTVRPTQSESAVPPAPRIPQNVPFSESRVNSINLAAYPIVGRSTQTARTIYLRGRAAGRNPHQIAKVGDCFTEHEYFLKHFTWDRYDLGQYGYLQPVIDHFGESMDDLSYGASVGFLAGAVLDPMWANPEACQPEESPLACEYRVHNPSVAIIMFGTQDVLLMTAEQFDTALRDVVSQTVHADIVPILSTFPGNMGQWEKSVQFNQIVVRVALDFDIPLINLWLALEALPGHGLDGKDHLSFPTTTAGDLTEPNLFTGYTMRNLVTLQTLDVVWRNAMR